jgi:hypothetical protein
MKEREEQVLRERVPPELARAAELLGATSAGAAPRPPREERTEEPIVIDSTAASDGGSAPEGPEGAGNG